MNRLDRDDFFCPDRLTWKTMG